MLLVRIPLLAALLAALLLALLAAASVSASNALYSCTKNASGVFQCDQAPAVGQHVQLNTFPGACHVSITQLRTGRGGVKLADVTVAHPLNCPWPTGSLQTMTYTAPTSPAVGGIMGLIETPEPAAASTSRNPGFPMGQVLIVSAVVATLGAVGLCGSRRQKMRPERGADDRLG